MRLLSLIERPKPGRLIRRWFGLPSRDGDCIKIINSIRQDFPPRTLFVLFNAVVYEGVGDLIRLGRRLDLHGDPTC